MHLFIASWIGTTALTLLNGRQRNNRIRRSAGCSPDDAAAMVAAARTVARDSRDGGGAGGGRADRQRGIFRRAGASHELPDRRIASLNSSVHHLRLRVSSAEQKSRTAEEKTKADELLKRVLAAHDLQTIKLTAAVVIEAICLFPRHGRSGLLLRLRIWPPRAQGNILNVDAGNAVSFAR